MRKLDRSGAPECLRKYRHGKDDWRNVSADQDSREEIWQQIEIMQGVFCAYCESRFNKKRHIEHFFRRREQPQLTFEWTNLFGSCDASTSCGGFKDNKAPTSIDLHKVCKPDCMDPVAYLTFLRNGKVVPKEGLSDRDAEIAENTIKVFNLNGCTKLVGKRREAARVEQRLAEGYYQLFLQCTKESDPEMKALLENELKDNLVRIENEEYSAVLRQVWTG